MPRIISLEGQRIDQKWAPMNEDDWNLLLTYAAEQAWDIASVVKNPAKYEEAQRVQRIVKRYTQKEN